MIPAFLFHGSIVATLGSQFFFHGIYEKRGIPKNFGTDDPDKYRIRVKLIFVLTTFKCKVLNAHCRMALFLQRRCTRFFAAIWLAPSQQFRLYRNRTS